MSIDFLTLLFRPPLLVLKIGITFLPYLAFPRRFRVLNLSTTPSVGNTFSAALANPVHVDSVLGMTGPDRHAIKTCLLNCGWSGKSNKLVQHEHKTYWRCITCSVCCTAASQRVHSKTFPDNSWDPSLSMLLEVLSCG